jgi:hypothetical protein
MRIVLEVTIMFCRYRGATACGVPRRPKLVFTLYETIYPDSDESWLIVGGVSVAVAGLPDPRNDHHVVMARFARLPQIPHHDEKLETTLGPDTTDLGLRVGLPQWSRHCRVLRGRQGLVPWHWR